MAPGPGARVACYEILGALGQGGMGAVYKARDTRLGRLVAIKVILPGKAFAEEARQRFQAEARAISRLNHPHICTLYDVGEENGLDYLVMEYVEGRPLDRVIPRNGLRVNEALPLASQMAGAIAAAHKAGIVHRDLKPGNIIVNDGGQLKVLDFGLAKLTEITLPEDARTLTQGVKTEDGTILGTVSYMSPEQAQAKPVDRRSDIFSFGIILHEMLAGRRPFNGDSKAAVLAAILHQEPEPLGEDVPADLRRLIERCLRKDPARRLQHMDDVGVLLDDLKEDAQSGRPGSTPVVKTGRKRPAAAAVIALAAVGVAVWKYVDQPASAPAQKTWKLTALTSLPGLESSPSFSPDGSQVAFQWNRQDEAGPGIYVKVVGADKPLFVTSGREPQWSPDGRWIAFARENASGGMDYRLVLPTGGGERKIAESQLPRNYVFRPAWLPDARGIAIVEPQPGTGRGRITLLMLDSGERIVLTNPPVGSVGDSLPAFAPGAGMLAFDRYRAWGAADVYLQRLRDYKPDGEPKAITAPPGMFGLPVFLPNGKELLYGVWESKAGSLVYRAAIAAPEGSRPLLQGRYDWITVSRDGRRVALSDRDSNADVFEFTIASGTVEKVISSTRIDQGAEYSPDGSRLVFQSSRTGNAEIWTAAKDGSGAVQITSFGGPITLNPHWSPDGKWIAFSCAEPGNREAYVVSAEGGPVRRLTTHAADDVASSWSRDGKWIYLSSNRSGREEVYRAPAGGGEPVRVTRNGGSGGRESEDGKALYFLRGQAIMQTRLENGTAAGEEVPLTEGSSPTNFTVTRNGLYFIRAGEQAIRYFDLAAGKDRLVHAIAKPLSAGFGLSVSPDGKSLLFSASTPPEGDLFLIEGFQ